MLLFSIGFPGSSQPPSLPNFAESFAPELANRLAFVAYLIPLPANPANPPVAPAYSSQPSRGMSVRPTLTDCSSVIFLSLAPSYAAPPIIRPISMDPAIGPAIACNPICGMFSITAPVNFRTEELPSSIFFAFNRLLFIKSSRACFADS